MLHRTELQTIQKAVKSLTPSYPGCPPRPAHSQARGLWRRWSGQLPTSAPGTGPDARTAATHRSLNFNCSKPRLIKDCSAVPSFPFSQNVLQLPLPFGERTSSPATSPVPSLLATPPYGNWEDETT